MKARDIRVSSLVVVMLVSGCGSDSGTSETTTGITIGDTSTGVTQPFEVDVPLGPGDFVLAHPGVGLDELSAYTATMTVSFEGTRDGQPESWAITYTLDYSQEPPARRLTIESSGDGVGAEFLPPGRAGLLMVEAEGSVFEVLADGTCAVGSLGPTVVTAIDLYGPFRMLPAVLGAEDAGQDTVGGLATSHYTFDQRALVQTGAAEGEMWVAAEGGYVVRFIAAAVGEGDYFGEGVAGTLTKEYVLSEINVDREVGVPPVCLEGMLDIPLLSAFNLERAARDALSYQTDASVADTVAFYQEGMPAEGWTLVGDPTTEGSVVIVQFERDGRVLFVIVSDDGGTTRVDAVLGTPPPPPS